MLLVSLIACLLLRCLQSLFTSIDNTVTSVGAHLLRANLVSPSTSQSTIDARLDFVDAFLSDETMFYDVLELLERLPDLEKTLSGLVMKARSDIDKKT